MKTRWRSPLVVTAALHLGLGGLLWATDSLPEPPPERELVEMEIIPRAAEPATEARTQLAKTRSGPKEVRPDPVRPPEPAPAPAPALAPAPAPEPAPAPAPAPAPEARTQLATASSGPKEVRRDPVQPPAPARVYNLELPDSASGVGIPTGGASGGGTGTRVSAARNGTGTGSGNGTGNGTGSGNGTGKGSGSGIGTGSGTGPVSIAGIKTPARALGDRDFIGNYDYPESARRNGVEGPVKVKLVVSSKGRVTNADLVTKLGHGLDQRALKLAHRLRFRPAKDHDDRPVASVVVWTFRFRIPA